jgi:hypothetical protein
MTVKQTVIIVWLWMVMLILVGLGIVHAETGVSNTEQSTHSVAVDPVVSNKLTRVIFEEMQPKLDPVLARRIAEAIMREAKANNLPPSLIAGVIAVESDFRPLITSNKGAAGLMQVLFKWWKDHEVVVGNGMDKNKLYWIEFNIKLGCAILAEYLKEADDSIAVALNRYHTGSTTLPKGTKAHQVDYVNKVLLKTYQVLAAMRKE